MNNFDQIIIILTWILNAQFPPIILVSHKTLTSNNRSLACSYWFIKFNKSILNIYDLSTAQNMWMCCFYIYTHAMFSWALFILQQSTTTTTWLHHQPNSIQILTGQTFRLDDETHTRCDGNQNVSVLSLTRTSTWSYM